MAHLLFRCCLVKRARRAPSAVVRRFPVPPGRLLILRPALIRAPCLFKFSLEAIALASVLDGVQQGEVVRLVGPRLRQVVRATATTSFVALRTSTTSKRSGAGSRAMTHTPGAHGGNGLVIFPGPKTDRVGMGVHYASNPVHTDSCRGGTTL